VTHRELTQFHNNAAPISATLSMRLNFGRRCASPVRVTVPVSHISPLAGEPAERHKHWRLQRRHS
jgi:hypothetical protein